MACNNLELDLVNMNPYNFGKNMSICSQDIEGKRKSGVKKDNNSGTNLEKMNCNNRKLDLDNMKAFIKFGDIMSICFKI